ncbi:hypothetical protein KIN20_006055 [Parelaphostrongylus tenuis]|uniref:Uncharacterized protein n=1 Tax=Parelaphostrongylus tenuis TaxID=148309 RepID=A0AAD5QFN9_PARTN|nr:hypothetical protein KIN20_006055 [Parelaphostrongylus tenuis]
MLDEIPLVQLLSVLKQWTLRKKVKNGENVMYQMVNAINKESNERQLMLVDPFSTAYYDKNIAFVEHKNEAQTSKFDWRSVVPWYPLKCREKKDQSHKHYTFSDEVLKFKNIHSVKGNCTHFAAMD